MPGSTPVYGFPYPVGTDRVQDGDNAIQALAEALESRLAGRIFVPVYNTIINGPSIAATQPIGSSGAVPELVGASLALVQLLCRSAASSTANFLAVYHAGVDTEAGRQYAQYQPNYQNGSQTLVKPTADGKIRYSVNVGAGPVTISVWVLGKFGPA